MIRYDRSVKKPHPVEGNMQKKKSLHSVLAFVAVAIFAALAQPAIAQPGEEEEEPPANITAIEAKTGIVTAQHTATGCMPAVPRG
ncbi:MAG TPA: hypothetical protein VMM77_12450 [Gemmatimonadaceae bacterium]|nr:hypothetical protein [Gemmatimonadaceae bacterium]